LHFGSGIMPFFPYSPPPRKLGAITPPFSIQMALAMLKLGVKLTLNPPYRKAWLGLSHQVLILFCGDNHWDFGTVFEV
jgi:hypothetical protein